MTTLTTARSLLSERKVRTGKNYNYLKEISISPIKRIPKIGEINVS